jgi:hypothetical protein
MRFKVNFRKSVDTFSDVGFSKSVDTFPADFGQMQAEPYEGEYIATPKVEAQTLPTAKKYLDEDITVLAIPYFETSNNANGKTVFIGKEI